MGPDEIIAVPPIEMENSSPTLIRVDPDGDIANFNSSAAPNLWPRINSDGPLLYATESYNDQILREYEKYQYESKNGKALFKEERDRDIYDLMNEELEINVDEVELNEIKAEIENAMKIESKRKSRFKHVLDKIIGG